MEIKKSQFSCFMIGNDFGNKDILAAVDSINDTPDDSRRIFGFQIIDSCLRDIDILHAIMI